MALISKNCIWIRQSKISI